MAIGIGQYQGGLAARPSMATLVGTALFGDGAAAVVAVGGRRAKKIAMGPGFCSELVMLRWR